MQTSYVSVVPTYLNFAILSEDFLPRIMFCFYPAFCSQDKKMYIAFSTLLPDNSLQKLATNKATFFFFVGLHYKICEKKVTIFCTYLPLNVL